MSFTEECEMYLRSLNTDTDKMTNKEIREMVGEILEENIDW